MTNIGNFNERDTSLMERKMSMLDMQARDIRMQAAEMFGDHRVSEIARAASLQSEAAAIRDWIRSVKNTEGE